MGEAFISSRGGKAIMLSGIGTLQYDVDWGIYAYVSDLPFQPSYIVVGFQFTSGTTHSITAFYDGSSTYGYYMLDAGAVEYTSPRGFIIRPTYFSLRSYIFNSGGSGCKFFWLIIK